MALSTARIHRVRGRPPLLAAGITSLIHSHSSSVRSLGYIFSFIYPFYTTREDFSDRLLDPHRTNGTAGATIFSRIFESSREGISSELARYILGLGFSTEDRSRMRELAAK